MMAAMTLWVSGRVLPFFTKARLQVAITPAPALLKPLSMTATWLLIPALIFNYLMPDSVVMKTLLALIALIAAVTHAISLGYMFKVGVKDEPMLWSLYMAYGWIITGYLVLAINQISSMSANWLHAITIGGLLGMILSMMARISLGHTGRKITALRGISIAFILIQLATLIRIGLMSNIGFILAIAMVLVAMMIFLYHYTTILIRPRADGRPD